MNYYSVDIGGTNTRLSIINDSGTIILFKKTPTSSKIEDLIATINAFCKNSSGKYDVNPRMGISIAGICNYVTGEVIFPNAFDGVKFNLRGMLENSLQYTIAISDDRTAGILGEKWCGQGKELNDFNYLIIGTGVGLGYMNGKNVFHGHDFVSGSIGWIVNDKGIAYERAISGPAIETHYKNLTGKQLTSKEIFDESIKRNENACKVISETGKELGKLLAIVFNCYNPEALIFAGSIGERWDELKEYAMPVLMNNKSPYVKNVNIVVSKLGDKSTLLGNVYNILD